MKKHYSILLSTALLATSQVFASGYEKSVLWGAKHGGTAGTAAASTKGADSIYFNPAGLVKTSNKGDLNVNASYIKANFKGPIVPSGNLVQPAPTITTFTNALKQESAKDTNTFAPAVTYSVLLTDDLAFGIGYYGVGGTQAVYENIDFSPRSLSGTVKSEISIIELGAGVGYKVADNFRLGLSLRYTTTTAAFQALSYSQSASTGAITGITNLEIKDLKGSKLDSVRIGAQYDVSEKTHLGLAIRTESKFEATGKASGTVNTCSGATCAAVINATIPEVDAKVTTYLPLAVNLGVEHNLDESWNLMGELVYTQYSKIDTVPIEGTVTPYVGSTAIAAGSEITDITQNWKDQYNVKLGAEYKGMSWPVRFGYIWTSQVTNSDYARASFTPPGAAQSLTLGTGQEFKMGDSSLEFNIAGEYTSVKGDSSSGNPQPLLSPAGSYEVGSYGLHTGLAYKF